MLPVSIRAPTGARKPDGGNENGPGFHWGNPVRFKAFGLS